MSEHDCGTWFLDRQFEADMTRAGIALVRVVCPHGRDHILGERPVLVRRSAPTPPPPAGTRRCARCEQPMPLRGHRQRYCRPCAVLTQREGDQARRLARGGRDRNLVAGARG